MASEPFHDKGWWREAKKVPSPNFGPRPAGLEVDLVVIHSISLPPGRYGGDEVVRLFTNQLDWDSDPYFQTIRGLKVSSHFLIRRTGQILQFVSVFDRAWHAGESKHCDRHNCNDFSVGIELEGLEGDTFTEAQYGSLAGVVRQLAQLCPITHLVGHEHIAPGRKLDPGRGFQWPRLAWDLGWTRKCFPELE